jgi:CheY-like chemotaxis protein
VLSNLINNAFKFTHRGYIKFGYKKAERSLIFFVEDTGIGISKKYHKEIFERFRQENKVPGEYGGTGLGLSISQKFVELLGGKIWVESEKGKGSVFYFTLPYKPVKIKIGNNKKESKQLSHQFTVLVAEDEEVNYLYIEEVVSKVDANVIHSVNGEEAVKMCKENQDIDLVLMDIKMPIMNGYEATKRIKAFRPDLPVIAQTAYAMAEDRDKALNAGCDGYVPKPIDPAELLALLNKYKKKRK